MPGARALWPASRGARSRAGSVPPKRPGAAAPAKDSAEQDGWEHDVRCRPPANAPRPAQAARVGHAECTPVAKQRHRPSERPPTPRDGRAYALRVTGRTIVGSNSAGGPTTRTPPGPSFTSSQMRGASDEAFTPPNTSIRPARASARGVRREPKVRCRPVRRHPVAREPAVGHEPCDRAIAPDVPARVWRVRRVRHRTHLLLRASRAGR